MIHTPSSTSDQGRRLEKKKVPLEKEDRMGPQGSSQRPGLDATTAFRQNQAATGGGCSGGLLKHVQGRTSRGTGRQ